jgi:hypothetical protein
MILWMSLRYDVANVAAAVMLALYPLTRWLA